MPARNTIKLDIPDSYYHVYSRGVAKQPIFLEESDFTYFRHLLSRHLSIEQHSSRAGVLYPHLRSSIELLAYCQMNNHFHLLFYQVDAGSLPSLMRSVMTAYSKYFNLRYKRTGPVFESRYKASRIDNDAYLSHISRYIHMNPRYYQHYPHSSYSCYLGRETVEWLQPERIMDLFKSPKAYQDFCSDYTDRREVLNKVKQELANY